MFGKIKNGAHNKGRFTPKRITKVEDAECPKGGTHELTNRMKGRNWCVTYCIKCDQDSSDIDMELNGER